MRKRLIADVNFDQVGAGLRQSLSFYTLYRTPDTVPSYINDLCASLLEFVARTNRERATYRTSGYDFSLPILAPTGSRDPLYALVDRQFSASDHRVYLDMNIPAALFNQWPDMWYHTSYDRPDKGILDATQMKRAAVIGVGALTLLAAADDAIATRVTFESLARGGERMSHAVERGFAYLTDAIDGPSLIAAYKEARNALRHQTAVEREVVKSSAVLFPDKAAGEKSVATLLPLIEARAAALQNEIAAAFKLQAAQQHIAATEPATTDAERQAARLVPERSMPLQAPAVIRAAIDKLSEADRTKVEAALPKMRLCMFGEFNTLLAQKKTALEIRDFLSGEFDPLPLEDLMDYLRALEKLGFMRLGERQAAVR